MAVYIKQSPPREGTRGGWEDFNWDSLKSQSNADRDYYLGASAKVGVCTRGRFEKFDWWTKKKEIGIVEGVDDELQRVKRFEHQLLEEALGQRPRHLLAGEALPDEGPQKQEASSDNDRTAAKALKKLKKEQKKLKKLKKKEKRREARRLRHLKKERCSDSPPRRETSPAFSSGSAQGFQDSGRRRSHGRKIGQEGSNAAQHEKGLRKRKRSHSAEHRNRHKSRRRSRSRQRNEADRHTSASRRESRPHNRHCSTEATNDRGRRHRGDEGRDGEKRAQAGAEERRSPRKKDCPDTEPVSRAPEQRYRVKRELLDQEKSRGAERRPSC